jgi:predicted XRE-type DNA-binding protein
MHLKLHITQIDSAELFDDNGTKIRDAEINAEMIKLDNAIEIDVTAYMAAKAMRQRANLQKLMVAMDMRVEV